jgi:hypothetical protein
MTDKARDDAFTIKMRKVRDVLTVGEGFVDAEVEYEREAGIVSFRAASAIAFKMRRAEFDARSDCEIAFFVSTRMRRPVASTSKPASRRSV